MNGTIPDLKWYIAISDKKSLKPRCPFATSERCPRYYQSLFLLGQAGATKIPEVQDKKLHDYWKNTDVWPLTMEQETSLSGSNLQMFKNFCPEVGYQHSGFFASGLIPWHDEEEQESFFNQGLPGDGSYKWHWKHLDEMHYSECPLYSLLPYVPNGADVGVEELVEMKPGFGGFTFDIKLLLTRLARWWLRQ